MSSKNYFCIFIWKQTKEVETKLYLLLSSDFFHFLRQFIIREKGETVKFSINFENSWRLGSMQNVLIKREKIREIINKKTCEGNFFFFVFII